MISSPLLEAFLLVGISGTGLPVVPRPIAPMTFQVDRVVDTFTHGIDTTFWTILDQNQDGYSWDTSYYNRLSVWPNPPGAEYDDDDNYWAQPGAEGLISAPLDMTGYSAGDRVFAQFLSIFQSTGNLGEYVTFAVQAWSGGQWGNWDTLWGVINRNDSGIVRVSLAHLAGADSIRVAFTYTDTAGIYGFGWGIDDIFLGHESPYSSQLSEDFETSCGTAAPPGWSVVDSNHDGHSWWVGTTPGVTVPSSGSCFAYYRDDYGTSTPAGEDWLLSPVVSLAGKASFAFSYDIGINFSSPVNESVFVKLRIHDGISWGPWQNIVRYGGNDISTHVDLDLSGVLPAESAQVAFVYADYDGGYHRAVGVDNVVITAIDTFDVDVATTGIQPVTDTTIPRVFTPIVITKNTGRTQQSYKVHFSIEDTLSTVFMEDSATLVFRNPGQVDTTLFPSVSLPAGIRVIRKAWTSLSTDAFSFNDTLKDTLTTAAVVDLQVNCIQGYAYGDPALPTTFSVVLHNLTDTLLTGTLVGLTITDLTAGSTRVYQDTTIQDTIYPYATTTLFFPPFQPPDLDHDYLLRANLLQNDDNPANDTATATFSTHLAPFGEVLAHFPSPFSPKTTSGVADITFRTDQQKLYLLRATYPGEVWAFQPETQQFSLAFNTTPRQMGVQEESRAITWWPDHAHFWIVQEGLDTSGQRLYLTAVEYDTTGTPTGGQLNLDSLLLHPQRIVSMGTYPRTQTQGGLEGGDLLILGNDSAGIRTRWTLHLQPLQLVEARPTPDSFNAFAYLARGVNWTLYAFNRYHQNTLLFLVDSSGTPLDTTSLPTYFVASALAFWERSAEIGVPGAHMKALVTDNYDVYVLSLGHTWDVVGISESPPAPEGPLPGIQVIHRGDRLHLPFSFHRTGRLSVDLYDAMGRHVAQLFKGQAIQGKQRLSFQLPAVHAGIYHLRIQHHGTTRWVRVFLLP